MGVVYDAAYKMGLEPLIANKWVDYMDEVGWVYCNCGDVTQKNFRRALRRFGRVERVIAEEEAIREERRARRLARKSGKRQGGSPDYEAIEAKKRAIEAKRREEASKADGAWDLCAERCANCLGGKHCPFYATPPQLREWPLAPEQCSKFKAINTKGERQCLRKEKASTPISEDRIDNYKGYGILRPRILERQGRTAAGCENAELDFGETTCRWRV